MTRYLLDSNTLNYFLFRRKVVTTDSDFARVPGLNIEN